ncbi:vascular endothelial growth factor receptor 1-like [Neocloeon triangulifer]|uniref:vascular endothelial growth factor receptor 1-like n=1 Tax=Neocloeon triangulifer TaxID=2078957 RepID=UPI00286F87AE|nr:vascular endothelial growth factor receptor 1-like [Neocloeon triangulifer]
MDFNFRFLFPILSLFYTVKCQIDMPHKTFFKHSNITFSCIGDGELTWHLSPELVARNITTATGTYRHHITFKDNPRRSIFSIIDAWTEDMGTYSCYENGSFKNSTLILVHPFRYDVTLYVDEFSRNVHLTGNIPPSLKWFVRVIPSEAEVDWFLPSGELASEEKGYFIKNEEGPNNIFFKTLVLINPDDSDEGIHRIVASADGGQAELNLTLKIDAKPKVEITHPVAYCLPSPSRQCGISCKVRAGRKSNFTSDFECLSQACDNASQKHQNKIKKLWTTKAYSFYYLNTNVTGKLTCKACNSNGCDSNSSVTVITNVIHGNKIDANSEIVYEGDDVRILCYVPKYPCKRKWKWSYQRHDKLETELLPESPETSNWQIFNFEDDYSYISEANKSNVNNSIDFGNYSCKAECENDGGQLIQQSYNLDPQKVISPKFLKSSLYEDLSVSEGLTIELDCTVEAYPPPVVHWFHNARSEPLTENDSSRFSFPSEGMHLKISQVKESDYGIYECQVHGWKTNHYIFKRFKLTEKSPWKLLIYLTPVIIFLFLLVIFLLCVVRKQKLKVNKLTNQEVQLFLEGATEYIDHNVALDQQADLLPYNQNYEFPREHLKLGKKLGSGAFGMVVLAEANAPLCGATIGLAGKIRNINKPKGPTVVAVKMVKPNAELSHIKALMKELKILMHLGKHLNVVNLLGACTVNLSNKELLVIVEYCPYGNLHSYLLLQRDNFVDQIDHLKDTLDFAIGEEDEEQIEQIRPARVTTKDLVCWSYQLAQGMQYLASKKIVHADLAARNILLAEYNVVKICDFGLSRNLYNDVNYLKKGDDPLPLKWMAIESINHRIFSSRSDVWSFGIVLWEFFSLAITPYPGITVDTQFVQTLCDGYRMDKPQHATSSIYRIMLSCWEGAPAKRPDFEELVKIFGEILDDNFKRYYVDLSDPYVKMDNQQNNFYYQDLPFSSPTKPEEELFEGYLKMNPIKSKKN